ncbi:putative superfamily 2 helicase [Sulfolobales Beppu filamentous virus 2]|uniref:Putative superfamily 2 helicase n=1 Tax=Sulfolobales Beppu filamentous virus 2 TaxID=2493123 RepID=A0A3Q8Q742_9VIRU|nr:putative superfamily 2 helicase [Sulfolobales Beppu filamentous virus 2]AZI75825.1 putative superfamily 2 helicase [Sulfolobales Beppu filamentous virus 2]
MTDVLIKGRTGSGKTRLMITKAGEFVKNYHRVFHLSPLRSLSVQLYQRYKELYGDIVTNSLRDGYKIYVLTYNQFNQFLAVGNKVFDDVIIFDEFSLIINPLFSNVIYSAIINSVDAFKRYFLSATPVDVGIKYDEEIDLGQQGSDYEVKEVTNWERYVDFSKVGFIYVPGVDGTRTVCAKFDTGAGVDVDVDDPVLASMLKRGVAYYNSQMSPGDREKVAKLLELGEVRVICTTTALNYGVDYKFDYGIFTSPRFLSKADFIQFAGRVGRRGHGVVYVTFDVGKLPDVKAFRPDEGVMDFARLIGGDYDYICKKYDICDKALLKTLAFHLVHPAEAKKIIEMQYLRVDNDEYRLCVLAGLMKSSVDVDPMCNSYGLLVDRSTVSVFRKALNLEKLSFSDYKLLQEASYKAHIIGILKDARFEDISLALKYGLPLEHIRDLVKLIDIPYIGRVRAYELYKEGVTRKNLCEKYAVLKKVVGEKIAKKIYELACTSKWIS